MSGDEQRLLLGDALREVEQRRSTHWVAAQHQDLRPVVLHVLLGHLQLVQRRQRVTITVRLRRAAPVHV